LSVPKTPAGRRFVDLSPDVYNMVRYYADHHSTENDHDLVLPTSTGRWQTPENWRNRGFSAACFEAGLIVKDKVKGEVVEKPKYVPYAKRPFAGPAQVLDYVGRYTHRVAISNNRLLSMDNGKVRFRWKDYRDGNRQKTMTLDGAEFIRRFLIHVLPDGFHRIRYYGFLGNCHRARKLERCRELLRMAPAAPAEPPGNYRERVEALTGRSLRLCPHCHTDTMVVIDSIMRPTVCLLVPDTS
jgi:Putative transposase